MSELVKGEDKKKKKNIINELETTDKLNITEQSICLDKEDERPGIGWEVTGGTGGTGGGLGGGN